MNEGDAAHELASVVDDSIRVRSMSRMPDSSAVWFEGWPARNRDIDRRLPKTSRPAEQRTWLLRLGWTKAGGPRSIRSLAAPT